LVPLNYRLQSGDQVEILTTKTGRPSRDWLNPHLGYVVTSRAKQKIRQWFRWQEREESIAQGREILEKELKRLGIEEGFEDVARLFHFKRVEDLFAAVGYGDINVQQIATRLVEKEEEEPELPRVASPTPPISGITVLGVGDLLTRVARCCHPLPGDKVVGYVTRGQGVTIHRQDCGNILRRTDRERLIEVEWGTDRKQVYPVVIKVVAFDRKGLLKDIAAIVEAEDVNMAAANATTSKKDHMAVITATLEIAGMAQLSRILAKIESLKNVLEARRQMG
jgi:GTP pyrophosphokinase